MKQMKHIFSWANNRSKKVKIGFGIFVVVIIGVGYHFLFQSTPKVQYTTAKATTQTLISSLSESGNVSGSSTIISSPSTGIITDVYVKNGDTVKAGQNLFKVTSSASQQDKDSAYAAYLSAKANLAAATNTKTSLQSTMFTKWKIYTDLATNGTYSNGDGSPNVSARTAPQFIEANDDWLSAEQAYINQDTVVSAAQASYNSASLAYAATQDAVVTAPLGGLVTNLAVTPGSSVIANTNTNNNSNNSSSTTSTPVLQIGNPNSIQVKVSASEVDVPQLKPGQKATITLDAFPTKTFVGTVNSIDSFGTTTSGVVTYNVYISFLSLDPSLLPGMTATAIIQTNRADNALTVPSTAVQTIGGQTEVRVLQNGMVSYVPVTTGISSDTDTQILSGLNEGDTIVTGTLTAATAATTGTSPFSSLGGRGFGGGAGGGGAAVRTRGN